jgi:hypothetical protein
MEASFTFRRGEEIAQREAGVGILQNYWKAFAPRDVGQLSLRIANSCGCIVAAYAGDVMAGVLEGLRLDIGGDPLQIPSTFAELTADGTWSTHQESGDTLILVDLTIAPEYQGAGLFEGFVQFARRNFPSPSGVIFTYSPLFAADQRYRVVQKHERLGARIMNEFSRSRPGLVMMVGGQELAAEDVAITCYSL